MNRYLYRGVNPEAYEETGGLTPKETSIFRKEAEFSVAEFGTGFEFGGSKRNAVVIHQLHQKGLPTSGLSFTPHIHRAEFYATHGDRHRAGYILVVDSQLLPEAEVASYIVNELVKQPSIPEDDEIILVAKNNGVLPDAIVVDIKDVQVA